MKTLNRSKLNYKLRKVHHYPIVFASAPSGFGKTTSIHSYLDNHDISCVWFSMYGQQDELLAWSKLIGIINQGYKDIDLPTSIPNKRNSMDAFVEVFNSIIVKPLFIILDDVIIHDIPEIMKSLSIYSHISIPHLHFIIITKDTMDNIISYHFSNDILFLTTNDFAFSKEETFHLCRLTSSQLSKEEIEVLYDYTHGWIMALSLMLESHKTYLNLYFEGDINILIRRVLFDSLSQEVQEDFMKLSVLKYFSLSFASKICNTKESIKKLIQLEKENHFIQTVNHQTYQFIPIFNEFLKKRLLISSIDIEEHIKKVGYYYLEQNNPIEAIETFFSIYDYESIIYVINEYSETCFSDIAPQLMIKVFERLPDTYKNEYPYIYLKWISDCITNFPQLDGVALLEDFKQRVDNNLINEDTQQMYGEYYLIHAFTYFNDVKKMMQDFKTSYKYFNGGYSHYVYPFMITTFGSCHMLFLYYNEIGRLKETLDYIIENVHYFIKITNGIHSGSINLVKAEYLYLIGEYNEVEIYATLSYKETIDTNQLSSAICCLFLLGRLYLIQDNQIDFKYIKQQLINYYTITDIPIIHCEIDCALGYLNILNNDYDTTASWLINGEFDNVYLLPEARINAYIIHGLYLIKEHNSIQLKYISELIRESNKTTPFVLADIYVSIFEIIYNYEIGRTQLAIEQLAKTIDLCRYDGVVSPIYELSFAFGQLFENYVPNTSFDEKIVLFVNKYLKHIENNSIKSKVLTPKEIEVLRLCSHGKTIKEIALEKHVSINTIQTHMKSIYKKLHITSKLEAVHYYNNNFK